MLPARGHAVSISFTISRRAEFPASLRYVSSRERAKAAHAVSVLSDVAALGFVQDVANVLAGVAQVFELGDEILDGLLEEDIIFPERVIGVDEKGVACHAWNLPDVYLA